MKRERKTRDLCQTHWQDVNPGQYAPDTIRYGTCAECGSDELVYRSRLADEAAGRAFIKGEIARLISEPSRSAETFEEKAERVLRFLEDVGFETDASLAEREGRLGEYIAELRGVRV